MKKVIFGILLVLSTCLTLPAIAQNSAVPTVNVNAASAAEIAETLQGVGEAKAEAIVSYREENGAFEAVENLSNVRGIGPATIEKNRERITLQ
jgi:competence protein ComEA